MFTSKLVNRNPNSPYWAIFYEAPYFPQLVQKFSTPWRYYAYWPQSPIMPLLTPTNVVFHKTNFPTWQTNTFAFHDTYSSSTVQTSLLLDISASYGTQTHLPWHISIFYGTCLPSTAHICLWRHELHLSQHNFTFYNAYLPLMVHIRRYSQQWRIRLKILIMALA